MSLQARITTIVEHIANGMHERQEIIAVALLGALSNQNTFLYGPPGTAKSLISRRIANAFDSPSYFECLMNRFSTPEELFGPVSIKELKEDRYIRKTDKYLPTAEFAFLDEIWKSSPAILNALLTLINEGIFRNGQELVKTPLKALIAASNETPEPNQGLDALYDRFIVRLMVGPIIHKDNFELLINSKPTRAEITLPEKLVVKQNEWESWSKKLNTVVLSPETITIIHLIRKELDERFEELGVYVSDRRWQKAVQLLKASAFFNDRKETNHSDVLLLSHCIWTKEENRLAVIDIVHSSVKEVGFTSDISIAELDREKNLLDKEIHKELFHKRDVYKTSNIGPKEYFKAVVNFEYGDNFRKASVQKTFYIPLTKLNSIESFHPVNDQGNEFDDFTCTFNGQGTCLIKSKKRNFEHRYSSETSYTPKVLFHKGDKKSEVNSRLIKSLQGSVIETREKLMGVQEICTAKNKLYQTQLKSVFVAENLLSIPLDGIEKQISDIDLRIKDCQRLEALCSE